MTVNMLFKMVPNVSFVYFAEYPYCDESSLKGYIKLKGFNRCSENRFNKYETCGTGFAARHKQHGALRQRQQVPLLRRLSLPLAAPSRNFDGLSL